MSSKTKDEQFEELLLSLDLPMPISGNLTPEKHDEFVSKSDINLKKLCPFMFGDDWEENYSPSDIDIIKAILITRGRMEHKLDYFQLNLSKECIETFSNAIMFLIMELNLTLIEMKNKIVKNKKVH